MIVAADIYNVYLALVLVIPITACVSFGLLLLYYGSNNIAHEFRFRLFPWSLASKVRRTRLEADLERAKEDLAVAKHSALQREMVHDQLADRRYQELTEKAGRALVEVRDNDKR